MNEDVEALLLHLASYRKAVDHLFSRHDISTNPQVCFLQILVSVSQLYLDYTLLLQTPPLIAPNSRRGKAADLQMISVPGERQLRHSLMELLESPAYLADLRPQSPFHFLNGLHTKKEYVQSFTLHLPEIYEESRRSEAYARSFLLNASEETFTRLMVSMEHIARNHISFVQQALLWAADEGSWE